MSLLPPSPNSISYTDDKLVHSLCTRSVFHVGQAGRQSCNCRYMIRRCIQNYEWRECTHATYSGHFWPIVRLIRNDVEHGGSVREAWGKLEGSVRDAWGKLEGSLREACIIVILRRSGQTTLFKTPHMHGQVAKAAAAPAADGRAAVAPACPCRSRTRAAVAPAALLQRLLRLLILVMMLLLPLLLLPWCCRVFGDPGNVVVVVAAAAAAAPAAAAAAVAAPCCCCCRCCRCCCPEGCWSSSATFKMLIYWFPCCWLNRCRCWGWYSCFSSWWVMTLQQECNHGGCIKMSATSISSICNCTGQQRGQPQRRGIWITPNPVLIDASKMDDTKVWKFDALDMIDEQPESGIPNIECHSAANMQSGQKQNII